MRLDTSTDFIMKWVVVPLLSIIGAVVILLINDIKTDIADIKSDTKHLIVTVESNRVRIENLERVVYPIKIYPQKTSTVTKYDTTSILFSYSPTPFLHEETFDISKYLKKRKA